ncbi:hypothetical protein [Amycolatopsis sp. NBC_01480]|uniref:hypothetical protein n=1 Tax=Amycolatopsis sp. NBC_01480 TaxID=2903562 RepID=UPI002E2843BA|nr:hypothetical protein [Amycolatopsis sp. NBC_01480]
MSEGDQGSNPASIGYVPPPDVGWGPVQEPVPDSGTGSTTSDDPTVKGPTDRSPDEGPNQSHEEPPVSPPPAPTASRRPVSRQPPLSQVSPQKLEADEAEVVARLLTRRQALLTGEPSTLTVGPADVSPTLPLAVPSSGFRRALPVSLYLENDEDKLEVQGALMEVLKVFDIEVRDLWPEIRGSSFRSFLARTRTSMRSPEFRTRLAKIERAVELQALHKVQAEVDAAQGDAVAKLITALGSTPTAMIQIGSVLLMKIDGEVTVRNLTQLELLHLERNPALLRAPAEALHELQRLNSAVESRQKPAVESEPSSPVQAVTQP